MTTAATIERAILRDRARRNQKPIATRSTSRASDDAAAPPSSVMNSRRLMGTFVRLRAAHYRAVAEERRCASQQKLCANVADGSVASHPDLR